MKVMKVFRTALLPALFCCTSALAQNIHKDKTYPEFAIGSTGIMATIEPGFVVTVQEVVPGSPAAASKLQTGDVLLTVRGRSLEVGDPRVPLGEAIGEAEAKGGLLVFDALRGDKKGEVKFQIPALGAYGEKSSVIIKANAKFVAAAQQEDGSYQFGDGRPERNGLTGSLAGLFLLSTGDAKFLPHIERHVRALAADIEKNPTTNNWHLGYQGILLAEYYLKTGDKSVLKGLKALCDQAIDVQAAGGWGHWGVPGPGYVQSGLMSSAGVPVLTTLILARECGIEVEEEGYVRAVKFMYRMVGHGCVPYGDHRSELWWSNTNGRNGMLACAFALLDEPRFQEAAQHLAMLVTNSYFQPEFGHTGGGFNVIWRGMASVHVPASKRSHYSRQMKNLAWYYDLCRQPGGGFSILPTPPDNRRYSGLTWGTGAVGLTYTAPLKTLRITGAPRTIFSVKTEPVNFEWGTEADRGFLSSEDAEGFGEESVEPHEFYDQTIGKEKGTASVELCGQYLRHFSPLVRSWAARVLKEKNSPEAIDVLADAVTHSDPRVRRAVYDALSGYDNWGRPFKAQIAPEVVSKRFLPAVLKTLNDPKSAWWEIDGALFALGRAMPEDIRSNMSPIEAFSKHEEWYLREAAFWALVGVHKSMTGEEFQKLADMYAESKHVFQRSSYDAGFRAILKSDKVAFDQLTTKKVVQTLGRTTYNVPIASGYGDSGIHEAAHRTMMIMKHFDNDVFGEMVGDFANYLKIWEPYYQHSVWLITGSKWQPGVLKVLDGLGLEAKPMVDELKEILERYPAFDPKRIDKNGAELEKQIREAISAWEKKFG